MDRTKKRKLRLGPEMASKVRRGQHPKMAVMAIHEIAGNKDKSGMEPKIQKIVIRGHSGRLITSPKRPSPTSEKWSVVVFRSSNTGGGRKKVPDSLYVKLLSGTFFSPSKENISVQSKKTELTKIENPKLDLSNIKIETPALPSRESEIVNQFTVLSRYVQFGLKKKDFKAANEREIIERYEQLNEMEKLSAFNELKEEYNSL